MALSNEAATYIHSCVKHGPEIKENNSTEKPVLSSHSKIDKIKVLKTSGSLVQVKYCRMLHRSILQYF